MRRLGVIAAFSTFGVIALVTVRPSLVWNDGDQLALVAAWCIALVAGAWLALVSFVALAALRRGHPSLARAAARIAPFGVRRAIEVAILGAAIALPAAPAHAVSRDQPVVRAPAPRTTAPRPNPPTTARQHAPAPKAATAPNPPPEPASSHHVVRAGENLWVIARAALVARGGPPPTEATIARYWQHVVETNRRSLRSGDPSLIYPGEVVSLPPQPPP